MATIFSLFSYLFFQGFGLILLIVSIALFVFLSINKLHSRKVAIWFGTLIVGWFLFIMIPVGMPHLLHYPFTLKTYGPAEGPVLPLKNMLQFFLNVDNFEKVTDIARDPNDVPPPITRTEPATVQIRVTAKEVIGEMAPGVTFNYWTFDGTVPGPMWRVREGDTVELTLANDPTSLHHHSIDLHAVTGPGGGAAATMVAPGEEKTITFKALNPGLFVYHCAHPNVPNHLAHGMYGMILVEPEEGLPAVDKEFYIMQGEFYNKGDMGNKGIQVFDAEAMLNGQPDYIVFNGRTKGAVGVMDARVGDTVRMFVGNAGVNLISSFHVIGEIFDRVYPEAAIGSDIHTNVQTTLVPAGGASIVEFGLEFPGTNVLVDHALSRIERGAWGTLEVVGKEDPEIFHSDGSGGHQHSH